MIRFIATAALLATMAAAPVSAATFVTNFGGTTGNVASVAVTSSGVTLTATSLKFFDAPGALTNLSRTTVAGQIRRTSPGIGVNGGASNDQLGTNSPGSIVAPGREAILITGTRALVDLGYGTTATTAGTIKGGLDGAALGSPMPPASTMARQPLALRRPLISKATCSLPVSVVNSPSSAPRAKATASIR